MTDTINPRAALAGRETRQFTVQPTEIRTGQGADGQVSLVGYASVTDSPYTIRDWLGDYTEVIEAGAFAKTLQMKDDVRLLLNHDGIALARTKSGTLSLREVTDPAKDPQEKGQTGLWVEADLDPRSNLVGDIKSAMERGDLDEMSFAFQVLRQEWDENYEMRTIKEVKLFDVSVVTYPANPATSVGLRGVNVDEISEDDARELLGRLNARFATKTDGGRDLAAVRAQAASLRLPA